MIVAYTGPTDPPPQMANQVARHVRMLPEGTIVISGGAFGIDTIVAEQACVVGHQLKLVVPAEKPWNRDLIAKLADDCGLPEVIKVPGTYRDRNEMMVELADKLIACLKSDKFYRSGEWMTKNIAMRANVPVFHLKWGENSY